MANASIKTAAKQSKVYLWEIADRMGLSDANFSRKLRKEFTDAEKEKAFELISEISKEHDSDAENGEDNE